MLKSSDITAWRSLLHDKEYTSPVEFLANNYGVQGGKEEKDLLESVCNRFPQHRPSDVSTKFSTQRFLSMYEMMFEHPALLHVPQFFLASEATSPAFAGNATSILDGSNRRSWYFRDQEVVHLSFAFSSCPLWQ